MMQPISFHNRMIATETSISNIFIDEYMNRASGEFIKVYLYTLRLINAQETIAISNIADHLNCTENDVVRAFTYWAQEGLMELSYSKDMLTAITMLSPKSSKVAKEPSPLESEIVATTEAPMEANPEPMKNQDTETAAPPKKPSYTPKELSDSMASEELSQLIFVCEAYLGKPLSATELGTLYYFYDCLHFSTGLIEYLVEYCVSNNKKSMRYIETVAIAWYQEGIQTVEQAKDAARLHSQTYFSIMKALGIKRLGKSEEDYISKWTTDYKLSLELILEACNRTILTIHEPSFKYVDSILTHWHKNQVTSLKDIKALDSAHHAKSALKENKPAPKVSTPTNNKFHNFPQRQYDYDSLQQQLLNKNL